MKLEEESYQLTIAQDQNRTYPDSSQIKRVRHVYLEEQNIYGRFVPYLLLKDQLQSEIDSSGNTALHHMCSHNSPYIPLFLSCIPNGDPILNRKSKLGHTPLDVAGLYCSKEYIDMLKQKGAADSGNVDYWAIQGANPTNWSGKIQPEKKVLIHWAAYNDMPDVITEFAKEGVSVSQPDTNGFTPIDLAVLNKSYNTLKVLAELGERPKLHLIKETDSISIKQYFKKLNESNTTKTLKQVTKISSFILMLLICLVLYFNDVCIGLVILNLFITIHIFIKRTKPEKYMDHNRKTEFTSELFLGKVVNRNNHLAYLLLHLTFIVCGLYSLIHTSIVNHFLAFLSIILFVAVIAYGVHFFTQIYAICKNLTYDELFNSHKWNHLWQKIKYVPQRKLVIRQFSNPEDRGTWQNIKDYFRQ